MNSTRAQSGNRQAQFGRVPYGVVAAGACSILSRNELAFYLVVCAHANAAWQACPSVERIAKLAGMSIRTAQRATSELRRRRLIQVAVGGGRGNVNVYTIASNPDSLSDGVSDEKPCQSGSETPPIKPQKGVSSERKPRHPGVTPTEEQREQSNNGADVDDARAGEVRKMLIAVGVDPGTAATESSRSDLTPDLVRCAITWADECRLSNRPGFILSKLRSDHDELARRLEARNREKARGAAEHAAMERDRSEVCAIPDAEWDANSALASQHIRKSWPQAKPEAEYRLLRDARDRLSPLLLNAAARVWRNRNEQNST